MQFKKFISIVFFAVFPVVIFSLTTLMVLILKFKQIDVYLDIFNLFGVIFFVILISLHFIIEHKGRLTGVIFIAISNFLLFLWSAEDVEVLFKVSFQTVFFATFLIVFFEIIATTLYIKRFS